MADTSETGSVAEPKVEIKKSTKKAIFFLILRKLLLIYSKVI